MPRAIVVVLLALSGCSVLGQSGSGDAPALGAHGSIGTQTFASPPGFETFDERERQAVARAEREALKAPPRGDVYPWSSGDVTGEVIVGPLYMVNALTCRSLVHAAERDGERVEESTTVCRGEDGDWQRVG